MLVKEELEGIPREKDILSLAEEDFLNDPVWRVTNSDVLRNSCATTNGRPFPAIGPLDLREADYVIFGDIQFADGTHGHGTIDTSRSIVNPGRIYIPSILVGFRRFYCYLSVYGPSLNFANDLLAQLGKASLSEVFPLVYRPQVEILGDDLTVTIPGVICQTLDGIFENPKSFLYQNPATMKREKWEV